MDPLIAKLFQDHYDYYSSVGIEAIKQQAGQVEQVSSDYQGRVIYELLQNAFDKAEEKIKVMVKDNNLYIANDGVPFTYRSGYDYQDGSAVRGDFQALCSISTSEKDVNYSIGNKGVGFKSVFSVSAGGFAEIHTVGQIIGLEGKLQDSLISFRVYDTFKNTLDLPEMLSKHERDKLSEHIREGDGANCRMGKKIHQLFAQAWLCNPSKK